MRRVVFIIFALTAPTLLGFLFRFGWALAGAVLEWLFPSTISFIPLTVDV